MPRAGAAMVSPSYPAPAGVVGQAVAVRPCPDGPKETPMGPREPVAPVEP